MHAPLWHENNVAVLLGNDKPKDRFTPTIVNLNEPYSIKRKNNIYCNDNIYIDTFSSSDSDFSLPLGMYQVLIKPIDNPEGAYAMFFISKNSEMCDGKVDLRILSAPGKYNERLDVSWNKNENLKIFYKSVPSEGGVIVESNDYSRQYIVKITE